MTPIRILIADDFNFDRDEIRQHLLEFGEKSSLMFEIHETSTFQNTIRLLEDFNKQNSHFDILFIDIDFKGDLAGGTELSGFEIIKTAFEICPLSRILVYSAQQWEGVQREEFTHLIRNGMVAESFAKQDIVKDYIRWFYKNFRVVLKEYQDNLFLWDIWENNKTILSYLKEHPIAKDQISSEIENYLDTILMLLMNRGKIGAEHILNRSLLQMYHRALEIFCEGDKSEKEIRELADKNVRAVAAIINKSDLKFTRDDRLSALHKIVAHSASPISKFGYKVNNYRNNAMHQSKKFDVDTANILFSSLALHLYMVPDVKPKIERIREFYKDNSKLSGAKDLKDLLGYVSFQIS